MRAVKIFIAAAWALSAALASAADVDPPSVAGRLNYISGPVSFAPAQASEDWATAALNRPLTTGDRLWTDRDGRAEMHVGALAIRMAAQTSVDVLNLEDRALQLRVAQGSVSLRVRRLPGDRLLEIDTPDGAVVARRPGTYRVEVDPSGAATMVVVRGGGQAELFTGNSSFVVGDNEEAAISGSRQELFVAPPPDEFDRWTAGRDQREDRVASTRYVPDEMTGYEDLDQYGEWRTVSDYGAVWTPAAVPAGWAPYRYGHWVWISPWGWTWVDDAPWGFAPFHYGRWVWLDGYWAWAPGRVVARPVYSPALVAFIGGSNFSVSVGIGSAPAVAWVPLGWREPYLPWYRASRGYVQNVNMTHVTNVTSITTNVTNITYVNRSAPAAVTVVSRENFVAARQVQQASLNVPVRTLAAAPVTQGAPVSQPVRSSFVRPQPGPRPPAQVATREAVAVNAPPVPVREALREGRDDRRDARPAEGAERPRVRVINRHEPVNLPVNQAPRVAAPTAQPPLQAPAAVGPTEQQRQQQAVQEQQRREQELRRQQDERQQRDARRQQEEQQKERQRAQQLERERQQQAAQEQQVQRQRELQRQEEQQRAQQQRAQEQQRRQQAAQEQQMREQARQQELRQQQQKAQQEQRAREQQARQQELRQRQEEQLQKAQQQKAQQERARQQQAVQEQRAREQQRAQPQRPEPQAAPQGERRAAPQAQEPEKGRRDRGRTDRPEKEQ